MMAPPQSPPRGNGEQRPRSVPHKGPFVSAVVITVLFYQCLVGLLAATFVFFVRESVPASIVLIGFLICSVALWVLSYFKRRDARCPLCKGTPFLDSRAHTHVRAKRFILLNFGTSNVVRSITSQKFRCHFCGTDFDLFKPVDRQRPRHR